MTMKNPSSVRLVGTENQLTLMGARLVGTDQLTLMGASWVVGTQPTLVGATTS